MLLFSSIFFVFHFNLVLLLLRLGNGLSKCNGEKPLLLFAWGIFFGHFDAMRFHSINTLPQWSSFKRTLRSHMANMWWKPKAPMKYIQTFLKKEIAWKEIKNTHSNMENIEWIMVLARAIRAWNEYYSNKLFLRVSKLQWNAHIEMVEIKTKCTVTTSAVVPKAHTHTWSFPISIQIQMRCGKTLIQRILNRLSLHSWINY